MKRWVRIVSGLALFLVLAGAAFVGGQLLSGHSLDLPGGQLLQLGLGGQEKVRIQIVPAKEISALGKVLQVGIFVRRQDNSIFIGTGALEGGVDKNPDGSFSVTSHFGGPVIEIIVTHETKIFRDVTQKQYKGALPSGEGIQQVIETGNLDEIGANSVVEVWGEQNGGRVVASNLLYHPSFLSNP